MTIGIYKIFNTKNKKVYIGSSKHIEKRWKEHIHRLENNAHHSSKLQKSYDKVQDKSVFKFEIIEELSEDQLKEREQHYIDLFDAFNAGYNCCAEVDNPKYSLKNSKKAINKKLLDDLYEEFMTLYGQNQDGLKIGSVFLGRLSEKHYKHHVYKNTNGIIKWFLDNYNTDDYSARFSVNGSQQYYLIISDKEGNEFVCYKWYKGKMYNSYQDTKLYQNCIELDCNKHYIVDVPNYNFKPQ